MAKTAMDRPDGLSYICAMDIRQLTPRYFVSPQIAAEDMADLAAAGITRILCNRPDSEVPPSHSAEAIRTAAEAAGLTFGEQPLTHQTMTPDVIAQNRALGVETGDVVLAYCASGTRSTIAWALGQAGDMEPDAIVQAAQDGGYDLSNLRQALTQPFV
ncbi:TIGR01244 family protein [Sulfitobacter pacificus]|uniref:TIGR01244 family protein n=2 Tax=Sulfitobacter pacificus TaxID=1499314 RepID=A0ABQ5VGS5_9RHOB|nr:TIGR01244 family protein [Sulfitobacter pacificus]